MRIAPDPQGGVANRLFVASEGSSELVVVETDTNQVLGKVGLGCAPTSLVAATDGSRVYASCADGILRIDAQSLAVDGAVPLPADPLPCGLGITFNGTRLSCCADDGRLYFIDTSGPTVETSVDTGHPIETCRAAVTPIQGNETGVVAWNGQAQFGVFTFDPMTMAVLGDAISPTPGTFPEGVAVTSTASFERGFTSDFLGRLARVSLDPPLLEQFAFGSEMWGVAVLPDNTSLLLTHAGDLELEFRGAMDLVPLGSYDLAELLGSAVDAPGLGLPIAIERYVDGSFLVTRAHVVQDRGPLGARVVRVPISSFAF
jgi:YVTN family beta-propeller protein